MIRRGLFFLILTALPFFLGVFIERAEATVEVGKVEGYGKTYLNYFMNHDYIERDKPYLYKYSSKALEKVRQQLVSEGKLEDLWVVFEIPSRVFELKSQVSTMEKVSKCKVDFGDTDQKSIEINNCYHIYLVDESNYDNFLISLLALMEVEENGKSISIESLPVYAKANKLRTSSYTGGTYYTNPVWSPNSKYVAFGVWKDGQVNYDVYDTDLNKYQKSDPLKGMMVGEPIWSADSRYLIAASLSEIMLFDTESEVTTLISVANLSQAKNFEVVLSFDNKENKLIYAFDTGLLANYQVYEYDIQSKQSRLRTKDVSYINWEGREDNNFKRVTSFDGRWEAKVEDGVDGSSREVVRLAVQDQPRTNKNKLAETINYQANDLRRITLTTLGGAVLLGGGFLFGRWYGGRKRLKHLERDGIGGA